MEPAADQGWFLRKSNDGTIYGPVSLAQLARWAAQAQVAPNDSISSDQQNWLKAPMLPALGMDWIIEVTSERFYGPTTLGAIREFLMLGEISEENNVINACDASRQQIRDISALIEQAAAAADTAGEQLEEPSPGTAPIAVGVNDQIRELQEALREERRAMADLEIRYRELEDRYRELVASTQQPRE